MTIITYAGGERELSTEKNIIAVALFPIDGEHPNGRIIGLTDHDDLAELITSGRVYTGAGAVDEVLPLGYEAPVSYAAFQRGSYVSESDLPTLLQKGTEQFKADMNRRFPQRDKRELVS